MTKIEAIILSMLIDHQELFGLQMVEVSNNKLKRGSVYVTLQRMEDKGFISSRQEPRGNGEIGIPRRLYKITGFGARVYHAYRAAHEVFTNWQEA